MTDTSTAKWSANLSVNIGKANWSSKSSTDRIKLIEVQPNGHEMFEQQTINDHLAELLSVVEFNDHLAVLLSVD